MLSNILIGVYTDLVIYQNTRVWPYNFSFSFCFCSPRLMHMTNLPDMHGRVGGDGGRDGRKK